MSNILGPSSSNQNAFNAIPVSKSIGEDACDQDDINAVGDGVNAQRIQDEQVGNQNLDAQNVMDVIKEKEQEAEDSLWKLFGNPSNTGGGILKPVTRPGSAPPVSTQPCSTKPGSAPPVSTKPGSAPPVSTKIGSAPPVSTQPISTQPISTQPVSTQPISTQPVSAQPVTAQPVTAQPVSGQLLANGTSTAPAQAVSSGTPLSAPVVSSGTLGNPALVETSSITPAIYAGIPAGSLSFAGDPTISALPSTIPSTAPSTVLSTGPSTSINAGSLTVSSLQQSESAAITTNALNVADSIVDDL